MRCQFCNAEIEEGAAFCTKCGKKQETASKDIIKNKILAVKSMDELKDILQHNPSLLNEPELAELYRQAYDAFNGKKAGTASSTAAKELWTWIRAGNNSAVLYENKANPGVVKNQFMNLLQKKMQENGLPISIHEQSVKWDMGKEITEEFIVQIQDHKLENPFSLLINFIKIGKFSFVRENLFITPPNLPQQPTRKVPNISGIIYIVLGIVCLIIGGTFSSYGSGSGGTTLGILMLCVGGGMEFYKYYIRNQWNEWDAAWERWRASKVEYTFQQVVNGELDCIQMGISKSIREVCEELYPNALVTESVSSVDQTDLEEAIAKKRRSME